MSRFLLSTSLAGVIAGATGFYAAAADRLTTQITPVKTGDLNLATERGARVLLRRVNSAANDLCALAGSPYFETSFADEVKCHDRAVAQAVSQVNVPMVTTEYVRRYGAASSRIATR